jgi:hypothetical protein
MSDGDIDYSTFTVRELEEALAGINRQKYPKNYANLRSAFDQRSAEIDAASARPARDANQANSQGSRNNWWSRFWNSRLVLGGTGLGFGWWAYDILSHPNTCPTGKKLIGNLVEATCNNFGHLAAASVPIFFSLVSLVLVARPRRGPGA